MGKSFKELLREKKSMKSLNTSSDVSFKKLFEGRDFDPSQKFEGAPIEELPRRYRKKYQSPTTKAILDLHGYTKNEALVEVETFLRDAESSRKSPVRIITGKGTHSPQDAVLFHAIKAYLNHNPLKNIKRFNHPKQREGGRGCFDIWLKL